MDYSKTQKLLSSILPQNRKKFEVNFSRNRKQPVIFSSEIGENRLPFSLETRENLYSLSLLLRESNHTLMYSFFSLSDSSILESGGTGCFRPDPDPVPQRSDPSRPNPDRISLRDPNPDPVCLKQNPSRSRTAPNIFMLTIGTSLVYKY